MTFRGVHFVDERTLDRALALYTAAAKLRCEPELCELVARSDQTGSHNNGASTSWMLGLSILGKLKFMCEEVDIAIGKPDVEAHKAARTTIVGTNAGCWIRVLNPCSANERVFLHLPGSS